MYKRLTPFWVGIIVFLCYISKLNIIEPAESIEKN